MTSTELSFVTTFNYEVNGVCLFERDISLEVTVTHEGYEVQDWTITNIGADRWDARVRRSVPQWLGTEGDGLKLILDTLSRSSSFKDTLSEKLAKVIDEDRDWDERPRTRRMAVA